MTKSTPPPPPILFKAEDRGSWEKISNSTHFGEPAAGIPDGLIVYDPDFKVLRFNAIAERLFNVPAASVMGHVLSPRDAADPALQILAQTIFSSRAARRTNFPRRRTSGGLRLVLYGSDT